MDQGIGGRISVRLDGVLNIDADEKKNAKMRSRPRAGFIGLQDYHASKGWVEYRNIRIQPLQANGVPVGFESLSSDGKGWQKIRTGHGSGGQWASLAAVAWDGEDWAREYRVGFGGEFWLSNQPAPARQ